MKPGSINMIQRVTRTFSYQETGYFTEKYLLNTRRVQ